MKRATANPGTFPELVASTSVASRLSQLQSVASLLRNREDTSIVLYDGSNQNEIPLHASESGFMGYLQLRRYRRWLIHLARSEAWKETMSEGIITLADGQNNSEFRGVRVLATVVTAIVHRLQASTFQFCVSNDIYHLTFNRNR